MPLLLDDGQHSYVYGPSATPIEQIDDTSGVVQYLHTDLLGTPRALTNVTGTVTGASTFDIHGNLTNHWGLADTAIGFTGNWTDPDTGLVYLRARDYDPTTGQFVTVDPALDTTHQPYAYAGNNPILATDLTGLCKDCTPWQNFLLSPGAMAFGNAWSSCAGINVSSLFAGITDTLTWSPILLLFGHSSWTELLRSVVAPGANDTYHQNGFYIVGSVIGGLFAGGGAGLSKDVASAGLAAASSTGRSIARDLTEQLAMEEVKSNPLGKVLKNVELGDPRWPASQGWVKMEQVVNRVVIHWVENLNSGAVEDFKFIDK